MKKIFSVNPFLEFYIYFLGSKSSLRSESHEIDIKLQKLPWYKILGTGDLYHEC